MKMKLILLKYTIVVFSVLTMTTANAFINDYPGSMAIKLSSSGSMKVDYGVVRNESQQSWLYVDLPLLNDVMASGISRSNVYISDQHPNLNIACATRSIYWSNAANTFKGKWGAWKSSSEANEWGNLSLGGLPNSGSEGYHEYIFCKIPPSFNRRASGIDSYGTVEN